MRAQRGQRGSPQPAPAFKSEEYLLLGNSNRGAGEPMVAVDPVDPKNIIVVAMGNLQQPEGKPVTSNGTDAYHHITKSTITRLGVTHDGGVNWDVSELPILWGKLTRCPNSFADVMKDGTFIAGCEPRETTTSDPDFFGMSALMISRDHGKTWGPVVQMISDYQLTRFAPGLRPVSGGFPGLVHGQGEHAPCLGRLARRLPGCVVRPREVVGFRVLAIAERDPAFRVGDPPTTSQGLRP